MLVVIDVIGIFGFNFIIINSANSGSDSEDSKNSKNSENSEDSQSSVDFKKSEKFMTDLSQRVYIYDYAGFFLFSFINTVITIRIDSNDRFFNTRKNRSFLDLIEKIMKYDNMK